MLVHLPIFCSYELMDKYIVFSANGIGIELNDFLLAERISVVSVLRGIGVRRANGTRSAFR